MGGCNITAIELADFQNGSENLDQKVLRNSNLKKKEKKKETFKV